MKKILIMSGWMHKSVHISLIEGFERLYKDKIDCKAINGFKLGGKKLSSLEKLYNECVKSFPDLWERFFMLSKKNKNSVNMDISKSIEKKFIKIIDYYKPNIILSVNPLFNGSVINILEKYYPNLKLFTLITDLINVNNICLDDRAEKIICPSKESARFIAETGIDKGKILTFGIPVREKFDLLYDTMEELREDTDLNDRLKILILNDTEKSKKIFYLIKKLKEKYDCDITVVCGKNNYNRMKYKLKDYEKEVKIFGDTMELFKLFRHNDLLITRCGPSTIAEAVNSLIPIIYTSVTKEELIPTYLEKTGIGYNASSVGDIFDKIEELLANDGEKLLKMRENQFNYYGRNAKEKIVKYIADNI